MTAFVEKRGQLSLGWRTNAGYLALGMAGVGSQTYLAREYMVALGGDETCIGVGLATWFAGIALGATGARAFKAANAAGLASLTVGLLAPSGLLGLVIARAGRRVTNIASGELMGLGSTWLLAAAIFVLPGILVGAAFVALATRVTSLSSEAGKGIGQLYVFESLGSLAAGASITWALLPWTTPFIGYSILLAVALWLFLPAARRKLVAGYGWLLTEAVVLTCLAMPPMGPRIEASTQQLRFESLLSNAALLDWVETPYAHLAVSRGETHALFTSGAYTASFPDSFEDESRAQPLMLLNQSPQRVLILGEFEPGMLQYFLKHPVQRLEWVTLDERAHAFVSRYLDTDALRAFSEPRVHCWFQDPRNWLRTSHEQFDLILLLEREPATLLLARNTTLEFAQLIGAHLAHGGTYVTRYAAGPNVQVGQRALLGASLYRTLGRVFPFVRAVPEPMNVLVSGYSRDAVTLDATRLANRWTERAIPSDVVLPETLAALVPTERIATLNFELAEAAHSVASSTDDRPVALLHAAALRQRLAQNTHFAFLAELMKHPTSVRAWTLLPSAILLLCAPLLRPRRRMALSVVHATCIVGATGMALNIMVLFSFQTYVGALYSELGLLSGLFMLGLAVGGKLGMRSCSMPMAQAASIGSSLLALLFWSVDNAAHLTTGSAAVFHGLLLLTTGAATGLVFPIAAKELLRLGAAVRTASAWVEAADHCGAAIAALMTAVVLVPILGLRGTALLLLGLQLIAWTLSVRAAESRP